MSDYDTTSRMDERMGNDSWTSFTDSKAQVSSTVRTTCIVLGIVLVAGIAYASFFATLLLPIILAPTICFFYYHSSLPVSRQTSTERLFWIYLITAIPGLPIMTILQGALLLPFINLLFGSEAEFFWHELETVTKENDVRDDAHRAARAKFVAKPTYWILVVCACFICFAGMEELLKYTIVIIAQRGRRIMHETEYILYGAAAGLSFATLENTAYIVPECQNNSTGKVLLTLLERMVLGTVFHPVLGMLTAANLARRNLKQEQLGFLSIIGPAVLFHGLLDFVLFAHTAWRGHIGWIHPTGIGNILGLLVLLVTVLSMTMLIFRRSLAKLQAKNSTPESSEDARAGLLSDC